MFLNHNPADGSELCHRETESWQSFLQKLYCLRVEQQSFSTLPVTARMTLLSNFTTRLEVSQDKLAWMICERIGRCLRGCRVELNKSIELIRYCARLAPKLLAHKTIVTQASFSQARFEPLGMTLAMMPWNCPAWQVLRFAIPALCAGSACAAKPAPSISRVTTALFDIIDSGLSVIPAWLDEPDMLKTIEHTDAMASTGSTFTDRLLAAYAGTHLKKSVLELGGSNALIVMPDTNLAQAAKGACYSRFRGTGQSCNAAKRIIVTQVVAEKLVPLFLAEYVRLKTGNPLDVDTTLAPLHRADLYLRVHEQVEDTLDNGAECSLDDIIPDGSGWSYPVTVLDYVNPNCRVYREGAFDLVAMLLQAKDATHAIELANDSPFSLGACVHTADTTRAWRFAEKIHAGSVFINRHTSSGLRLPLGGVKDSGYGRESSEFGLYEFANVETY